MRYIISAIIRGIIPFVIMILLAGIMKLQRLEDYQVKSTFLTGLMVTIGVTTSVIYDVESWSLIKQSLIHFLIMLITVYPCLVWSNWFPHKTISTC